MKTDKFHILQEKSLNCGGSKDNPMISEKDEKKN